MEFMWEKGTKYLNKECRKLNWTHGQHHSSNHSLTHKNWVVVWGVVLWVVHDYCSSYCSTLCWLFLEKCEGGKKVRSKIVKLMHLCRASTWEKCVGSLVRRITYQLQPALSFATLFPSCLWICFTARPWGKTWIVSLYCKNWTFSLTFSFNRLFSH